MDASELVDSLDSLWSFTNVLSSRTHNGRNVHDQEEDKRPAKPINPNDQNQPYEPTEAKLVTPRCSVCGEPVHPRSFHQELGVPKPKGNKLERRSGKARSKRKVAREEHKLGFDGDIWFLMSRVYPVKMPPLEDGLAMKQHLKSWAYAVACSVR